MAEDRQDFSITLDHREGYQFTVDFPGEPAPPLLVDEAVPLGAGAGPNPARLLATAIGHCLSASFLFCVRKQRIEIGAMRTTVEGTLVRNERGRLRIGEIRVRLSPELTAEEQGRITRCLELFEDFCLVTESVRHGVEVKVEVAPVVTAAT